MKTIKLYGDLGKRFGATHQLAVKTPAEALRALCAIKKGFRKYLVESSNFGVGYVVKNGNFNLENENQILEPAAKEIQIIPMVMGANAESRILIGAALIAVAVVASPYTGSTSLAWIPTVVGGIGASLVIGGVAQMISPPPKLPEPPERPDNKPSYAFNGPVNTIAQGHPVAVGYGRLRVGSAVISASITLEQIKAGFKRTKTTQTRTVEIYRHDPSRLYTATYPGPIPANFYTRTFVTTFTVDGVIIDRWTYSYYVWELVAL